MSAAAALGFIGVNAVLIAIALSLAYLWVKSRLENSIRTEYDIALRGLQHEYDQHMELFRIDQRRRERGAMIADLFAEWASKPADKKRLNQLAWEATFWLPPEMVAKLRKRLCNEPDAEDLKQLLVEMRWHLAGAQDRVDWRDIVHF